MRQPRPADQLATGGRVAVERPQLRAARPARARHRDGACGQLPGAGPQQRSVVPRQHVGLGAGHARERQRLAVRRRRRQRAHRRRRRHSAEHRFDSRVQGADPQLPGAVRQPRRHDGAREQQVGREHVARQPLRVLSQRRDGCAQLLRRRPEAAVEPEHLRWLTRRPDRQEQDVLLRRLSGQQHRRGPDDPAHGADGVDAPGHLHGIVWRCAARQSSTTRPPRGRIRRPVCSSAIHFRATGFRPTASIRSGRHC